MKALAAALAIALVLSPPAWAQAPARYDPPRAADGHPDLTGVWANPEAVSPLERNPNFGDALVVSPEQARTIADAAVARTLNAQPLQVDLTDHADLAFVRGEYRTRLIVDPPDGRLPYLPAAQKAVDDWYVNYNRVRQGRGVENPDEFALQDRCITHQGAPPMMIAGGFGMHRRIVQTHDHVLIYTESKGEPRIARMTGGFRPSVIRTHWGDSVGRWEGDVLVVETVNFRLDYPFHSPTAQKPIMVGPDSKVVERFTRVSDSELVYAFTVEDSSIYARPWLAEYSMTRSDRPIFEYACHEGNYAIPLMLSGSRADERKAAAKKEK